MTARGDSPTPNGVGGAAGPARAPGPGRREALADLTDGWLAGLFDGGRRHAARGPRWWRSAATAAGSSRRAATSTWCSCVRGPRGRRRRRARRPDLVPGVGLRGAAGPLGPDPGRGATRRGRRPAGAARAARRRGTWPATSALTEALRAAVLADWRGVSSKRLPELLDVRPGARRARRRAGLPARARPQGVARRAA